MQAITAAASKIPAQTHMPLEYDGPSDLGNSLAPRIGPHCPNMPKMASPAPRFDADPWLSVTQVKVRATAGNTPAQTRNVAKYRTPTELTGRTASKMYPAAPAQQNNTTKMPRVRTLSEMKLAVTQATQAVR